MTNTEKLGARYGLAGANSEGAGQHNQRVVLHAVRVAGTATRAEIAEATRLTLAAVSNITHRLIESGLLEPVGQMRGRRGQPATRLAVHPSGAFSIGVNIDRDHVTMVVVDFLGSVRARISRDMAFPSAEDVRGFFDSHAQRLIDEAGITRDRIVGLGVALPDDLGAVDLPGRPSHYEQWSHVDVAALFSGFDGLPVVAENDAAAAAIGEMQFGMGRHHPCFFYLLVTFGLGGGVVVNSAYDHGAEGRSGEIGFLHVDDGRGGRAQLQTIVSLAGLAEALGEAEVEGASVRDPDMANPRIAAIVNAWVERAAQALVEPLIAVNCLLNPGAVLIGGRLPLSLVNKLAQRADMLVRMSGRHVPVLAPVHAAELAEDSPAVGAALLGFGHLMLPADGRGSHPRAARDR